MEITLFPANEITEDDKTVWQYFDSTGNCYKVVLVSVEEYEAAQQHVEPTCSTCGGKLVAGKCFNLSCVAFV